MTKGIVKSYDKQKGSGLIQPVPGGKLVILPYTALKLARLDDIAAGQKVSFDVVESGGKPTATNLKKL